MSEFQSSTPIESVPVRIPVNVPMPTFSQNFSSVHTMAGQVAASHGICFQQALPTAQNIGSFNEFENKTLMAVRSTQDLTTLKGQVLQAFAGQPIFANNPPAMSQHMEAFFSADTVANAQAAARSMLGEVKQQHTIVKQQQLAEVVKAACQNLSFKNVQVVTTTAGIIKVNGANLPGQPAAFVFAHEIRTNEKGDVRLTSETLCLEDGSCRIIMEQFNQEMARLGVPLTDARRMPRVPIKPAAKEKEDDLGKKPKATKTNVKT